MNPSVSSTLSLSLDNALDRRPLTVLPTTSVAEAIGIMGKAQSSCVLPGLGLSLNTRLVNEARAKTLFVIEAGKLRGTLGEANAVDLILSGQDLTQISVAEVMVEPPIVLLSSEEQTVFTALSLLRQHQTDYLPVVDGQGTLLGVVTPAGLRSVLQLDELLKTQPSSAMVVQPAIHASTSASMFQLAQLMAHHQVECVVLTHPGEATDGPREDEPVGMVLAQHVVQLQTLGLNLSQIQAQAVMATPLLCCSPEETALIAYWKMQQHRVQRFVVTTENGKLMGVVTPTSFLHTLELSAIQDTIARIHQSIAQFEINKQIPQPDSELDLTSPLLENPIELLEQLRCSQILAKMALHIRESLDLHEILQTAVDEVRSFLQTDRVIVYQFNPDMSGTVVTESVVAGWTPALNSTVRDACFGQNYAQAYKEGRTLTIEDIYTAGLTQCHIDILVLYDVRASLVVPILQGEHLWGLLCAYHCSGPRRWRSFQVNLLNQLAIHMAIAIQQSELYQQVHNELVERKRTEEQLKQSLKEKEVLLKEIHHRVKNNLQVISSVLRLQSDYVRDDKVLSLFRDSQNRIRSMALIHEKLYQSKDLLRISLDEYIRDLGSNLLSSYTQSRSTHLRTHAPEILLNIDTAIPCGLIINELVSNSLKHAFPVDHQDNEISIEISPIGENKFMLAVQDNGVGFPEDLDFQNTESLGLELVCIFVEQLEGEIELIREPGTTFKITFSELDNTGKV